jgi:hypothetical protein
MSPIHPDGLGAPQTILTCGIYVKEVCSDLVTLFEDDSLGVEGTLGCGEPLVGDNPASSQPCGCVPPGERRVSYGRISS